MLAKFSRTTILAAILCTMSVGCKSTFIREDVTSTGMTSTEKTSTGMTSTEKTSMASEDGAHPHPPESAPPAFALSTDGNTAANDQDQIGRSASPPGPGINERLLDIPRGPSQTPVGSVVSMPPPSATSAAGHSDLATLTGGDQPANASVDHRPVTLQLSDGGPESETHSAVNPSEVRQASASESSPLTNAAQKTLNLVRSAIPFPGELERNRLLERMGSFEKFNFAFELPTVAGERVSSSSFGGQLLVVDVWATWCAPCKKGIPELIELQKEYESHGIQVIGITCDSPDGEDAPAVARRAYNIGEQLKVNYPLLVDDGTTIPQIPGFRGYPTVLLMTPDGQVRYMVSGLQSKAKLEFMIKTLLEI